MVTLVTLIALAIVGFIAYQCAKRLPREGYIYEEKAVTLSPRFSLNPKEHLLRDGILMLDENTSYDDLLWDCLFSREGDVYIKRTFQQRHTTWEHFTPDGESQGPVKYSTIQDMLYMNRIGKPIQYVNSNTEDGTPLTVIIKI